MRLSRGGMTGAVCATLLAVFAGLAWTATRSKSPTYDEPLHALGAWLHLHDGDFRINPEDPPLWHYWAALPNGRDALYVDRNDETYKAPLDDIFLEWNAVVHALFQVPQNDLNRVEAFFARSQAMMLIVAVGLGAMIGWWSWRLGGAMAAIVATTAYALDPNFIGHGALVKNDVAMSLALLGAAYAVWRIGDGITVGRAMALMAVCGAAVNIKFSAILLGPIVALLLIWRALSARPWRCLGRVLEAPGQRVFAALALCCACFIFSYFAIWACYRFRFAPTPTSNVWLDTGRLVVYAAGNELTVANHGAEPSDEQVKAWKPGVTIQAIVFLEGTQLLPQAWVHGLLYTYQSAIMRRSYLLGEYSVSGWWYYFPFAMLVKSPLALVAGALLALAVGVKRFASKRENALSDEMLWTLACLVLPPAIYLAWVMPSNLNIGVRHVFPVYPLLYIGIGLAAAWAYARSRTWTRAIVGALALGLAVESLLAFPNYIAFFNTAAGGSRGGLRLLSDSNLDWGQDLKELYRWQQENPNHRMYLAYFGTADPAFYGIRYRNLPAPLGYAFGEVFVPPTQAENVVLAIGATHLQGVYLTSGQRRFLEELRAREPLAVLGGTIYLYEVNTRRFMSEPALTTTPAD